MTKFMTATHFSGYFSQHRDAYLWASKTSEKSNVVSMTVKWVDDVQRWQGVVEIKVPMSGDK